MKTMNRTDGVTWTYIDTKTLELANTVGTLSGIYKDRVIHKKRLVNTAFRACNFAICIDVAESERGLRETIVCTALLLREDEGRKRSSCHPFKE